MSKTSRQGIGGQQCTIFELQLLDKDVQEALLQDIGSEVRINYRGSLKTWDAWYTSPLQLHNLRRVKVAAVRACVWRPPAASKSFCMNALRLFPSALAGMQDHKRRSIILICVLPAKTLYRRESPILIHSRAGVLFAVPACRYCTVPKSVEERSVGERCIEGGGCTKSPRPE